MPRCGGYYSFDISSWHVIVLNAMQCGNVWGGSQCWQGSPQEQWLVNDLKSHPNQCTIATWHEPFFSGFERETGVKYFWNDLYKYGVDVVLNGHVHRYERWAPLGGVDTSQNSVPVPSPDAVHGIREFIVGTGGVGFQPFNSAWPANLEVLDDSSFGVLKLTLHSGNYGWDFVPAAGGTFTDSGSGSCHGKPGSAETTTPSYAAGAPGTSTHVFDWTFGGSAALRSGEAMFRGLPRRSLGQPVRRLKVPHRARASQPAQRHSARDQLNR